MYQYVKQLTIGDELRMESAVKWAYENPLTEKALEESEWGANCTEETPNVVDFEFVRLCFTIEENDGGWHKHLSFFIKPVLPELVDKYILPNEAISCGAEYFGYRFDGPFQFYVERVKNLLLSHLYETV